MAPGQFRAASSSAATMRMVVSIRRCGPTTQRYHWRTSSRFPATAHMDRGAGWRAIRIATRIRYPCPPNRQSGRCTSDPFYPVAGQTRPVALLDVGDAGHRGGCDARLFPSAALVGKDETVIGTKLNLPWPGSEE